MESVRAERGVPAWFRSVAGTVVRDATAADVTRALARWSSAYESLSPTLAPCRPVDERVLRRRLEGLAAAVGRNNPSAFMAQLEELGQDLARSRVRVGSVVRGAQAAWLCLSELAERLPAPPNPESVLLAVYESLDVVLNAYNETFAMSGAITLPGAEQSQPLLTSPMLGSGVLEVPTSTAELDRLLPQALARAVATVGAESGSLLLRSDLVGGEIDEWVLTTAVGLPVPHALRFPRDSNGSNELTARAEMPVVISAARNWAVLTGPEREFVERCGIASAVGVALRSSDGDTLGVLFTNSGRERFFDEATFDDIVRMGRTIGDSLARTTRTRVFHQPLASLGDSVSSRELSVVEERLMSALMRDRDLEDVCRALEESSGCSLRVVEESRGVVYSSSDVASAELVPGASSGDHGGRHGTAERSILGSDGFAWGRVIVRDNARTDGPRATLLEVATAAVSGIERWERARASGRRLSLALDHCLAGVLHGSRSVDELTGHPDLRRLGDPPYRLAAIVLDEPMPADAQFDPRDAVRDAPARRLMPITTRDAMLWIGPSDALTQDAIRDLLAFRARVERRRLVGRLVLSPRFDSITRVLNIGNALRQTAELARKAALDAVLDGHELGSDELLLLGEPELRQRFVERVAGRLFEYDRLHDTELVKSVAVFLDHGCSIKHAAERLYVHPNTLRYRLGRAEALVPGILDSGEGRLHVQLALTLSDSEPGSS
ncbi:helix-turn-helix domain-containing protein [Capillimicrobium parvum]|nr:helix-turn-helix domain-containing protein [Capillimicrobium parvum]